MKVEQLIEALKTYDTEAEVYIYTGDINLIELTEIEQSSPSVIVVS